MIVIKTTLEDVWNKTLEIETEIIKKQYTAEEIKERRNRLLDMFRNDCYLGLRKNSSEKKILEYLKNSFAELFTAKEFKFARGEAHYYAIITLGC